MSQSRLLTKGKVIGGRTNALGEARWITPLDWRGVGGVRILTNETSTDGANDWRSGSNDATTLPLPEARVEYPYLRRPSVTIWELGADWYNGTGGFATTFTWELLVDGASATAPIIVANSIPTGVVGANSFIHFTATLYVNGLGRLMIKANTLILDYANASLGVVTAVVLDENKYFIPTIAQNADHRLGWTFTKTFNTGEGAGKIANFVSILCYQPVYPTGGWK